MVLNELNTDEIVRRPGNRNTTMLAASRFDRHCNRTRRKWRNRKQRCTAWKCEYLHGAICAGAVSSELCLQPRQQVLQEVSDGAC